MSGAITAHPDGVSLAIRVKPRAKANRVRVEAGRIVVEVTAPPVEGAANTAVLATLAAALGVKKRQLTLLVGETSREKVVLIAGVTVAMITERLLQSSDA